MSRASKKANWVNNEKILLALYQDWGIPALLESKEGRQSSKSTYDVRILLENPIEWASDAKVSDKPFRQNTLLKVVQEKYCKKLHQEGVLFCRNIGDRSGAFNIRDQVFCGLLSYFLGVKTREEVLDKWGIK